MRGEGKLAGIGIAACLEPSGGNATFEALLNPAITTSTCMDSCRINVDAIGAITATMHTTSSGQGHETLVGTVIGEVLQVDPDSIRVMRPDSLNSLPSETPVGSRMAIMLGGAAFHAAGKLKNKLTAIGAHDLGIPLERAVYKEGAVRDRDAPQNKRAWADLVQIAHRNFHRLPEGLEPGLSASHVDAGADRRRAADGGRAGADVSLLLVRVPSDPAVDRSRSRQAGNPALPGRA